MDLYEKAVSQANSVLILAESSLFVQAFQQWRTLYESYVICKYINKFKENDNTLCLRYICHGVLKSTIQRWKDLNTHFSHDRKGPYDQNEIERRQNALKKIGNGHYAWAATGDKILKKIAASDELAMYHHIASKEIHPTFGQRFMLDDLTLPMKGVPMLRGHADAGTHPLPVEYLAALVMHKVNGQVNDFLCLGTDLLDLWKDLREFGSKVIAEFPFRSGDPNVS